MEEKQFQALMEEIKKSRKQVEGNLSSSISELKKELTSVKQEILQVYFQVQSNIFCIIKLFAGF